MGSEQDLKRAGLLMCNINKQNKWESDSKDLNWETFLHSISPAPSPGSGAAEGKWDVVLRVGEACNVKTEAAYLMWKKLSSFLDLNICYHF